MYNWFLSLNPLFRLFEGREDILYAVNEKLYYLTGFFYYLRSFSCTTRPSNFLHCWLRWIPKKNMIFQLDDKSDNLQRDVGQIPSSLHSHRHQLLQQESSHQVFFWQNLSFFILTKKLVLVALFMAKTAGERCKALWCHTQLVPPIIYCHYVMGV